MATRKSTRRKSKAQTLNIPLLIIGLILLVGIGFGASCEFGYGDIPVSTPVTSQNSEVENVNEDVSVHFIDVGQGDSCLIIAGDTNILIDAGEQKYGEDVIDYLKKLNIKRLDYVIATHPHSDHIGGLPEVIETFDVGKILMPKITGDMVPTTKTYEKLIDSIKAKDMKATRAKPGLEYDISVNDESSAKMEILAPCSEEYDDLNNYSVVVKFTYKDVSFMLTGDAEDVSEKEIINSGADLKSTVLKVGHHGSDSSSTDAFLSKVNPEICVISCGAGNKYGHPDSDAVKRMTKYTDKIYRTDLNGNIVISTDGKNYSVNADS